MTIPDRPFSREEEYLASIAGQEGVKPERPLSRKEQYLDAIDEHMDVLDDVLDFPTVDDFPEVGETGKIYIANDANATYRWDGGNYVQMGGGGGSGDDNSVYLTRSGNNFPLQEGSDELKGLCKILNNFLFHDKKAFTVVFEHDGNSLYQISQDMNVLSPSTAYVPIILICENSRIRTSSGSNYYGIMYHSCSPQTVQLYVPKSEYDSQNIQNIYSDYQLTSRSLQLRNDGEAWTVDNISTGPLGTANTQSYTPTQNYHPATKKYVDDKIKIADSAPTTSTVGVLGQIYIDTSSMTIYLLTNISGDTYTWTAINS